MAYCERYIREGKVNSPLLAYAKDITSQGGEDGIIERLFELIPTNNSKHRRIVVDVGAWDGIHLSNSYNLLNHTTSPWNGVLFEADHDRVVKLQELYHNRLVSLPLTDNCHDFVHCVESLVDFNRNSPNSLKDQLLSYQIPSDFDFLSVDVDGNDYHIWSSLQASNDDTMSYKPSVVCIEFNPTIPNDVIFIQEADIRIQQGSSLRAFVELATKMNYTLVVTTMFNGFFVRNDLLCHLNLSKELYDNIDLMHSQSMTTLLFQTYDGELKLVGPKKLLWHRKAINIQAIQVLSKKERHFPFSPPQSNDINHLYQLFLQWYEMGVMGNDFIASSGILKELLTECVDKMAIKPFESLVIEILTMIVYCVRFVQNQSASSVESNVRLTLTKQDIIKNEGLLGLISQVIESDGSIAAVGYTVSLIVFQRALKLKSTTHDSIQLLQQALGILSLIPTDHDSSIDIGDDNLVFDSQHTINENILTLQSYCMSELSSRYQTESDDFMLSTLMWNSMKCLPQTSESIPVEMKKKMRNRLIDFILRQYARECDRIRPSNDAIVSSIKAKWEV